MNDRRNAPDGLSGGFRSTRAGAESGAVRVESRAARAESGVCAAVGLGVSDAPAARPSENMSEQASDRFRNKRAPWTGEDGGSVWESNPPELS